MPPSARPLLRIANLFARPSSGATDARLAVALNRLGPSYVKLGQFLATRPDVVGPALARASLLAAAGALVAGAPVAA